ncbi:hypothetical protein [Pseudomonas nunensis]|uniref:hypothetical protein n=1 Tax=Pseudomonas nunensis TaxID=2961896 RepID=UPI0025B21BB3|nr:hypothetical protein [Pseudomonas nunensis]MDN3220039.1 hypothetical protein [Pseudomonas nunensis]
MRYLNGFSIIFSMIFSALSLPQVAGAECFKSLPINELSSRNVDYFKDLANWRPPIKEAKEVKRFLPPGSGVGNMVNIDFYYVIFRKPPDKTLAELFKDIRLHFGEFARGATSDYDFQPYGKLFEVSAYSEENRKKWESDNPTGALMSFKLDTQFANPKTFAQKVGYKVVRTFKFAHPWGDVQSTCATDTDFVFSTVETVRGYTHPVAGNRGFGIRDAGNGNWIFYSKAVDRESDSYYNKAAPKSVFCHGHLFWLDFYSNVKNYLNSHGMPVQSVVTTNRGIVWWPFRSNEPPPNEPSCG